MVYPYVTDTLIGPWAMLCILNKGISPRSKWMKEVIKHAQEKAENKRCPYKTENAKTIYGMKVEDGSIQGILWTTKLSLEQLWEMARGYNIQHSLRCDAFITVSSSRG